MKTTDVYQSGS